MDEAVIRIRQLGKDYQLYDSPGDRLREALHPFGRRYHKVFRALDGIDLEVRQGEIIGIVGRNGSGKSTLLKLISGVLTPSQGTVEVRGRVSALLELGSGLNPEFTGLRNLYFLGALAGFSRAEMRERLDDILTFADVGDFIHQPVKHYSSGMRARLAFAAAVHSNPDVLILDEVLAVGDVLFRRKCHAKMEELFAGGRAVLFVSHDANAVNSLCSRAILLDGGRVLLAGRPKTVTAWHQKYLFAPEEKQAEVRAAIAALGKDGECAKGHGKKTGPEKNGGELLAGFRPKSTVEYRHYEVDLLDPHLLDQEGRRVNLLRMDGEYRYVFRVRFHLAAQGVSFGTRFKDVRGMLISGAALHLAGQGLDVEAGEEYEVCIAFTCRLLAGVFYSDTGVSAMIDGERRFLNRLVDALVFKVEPPDDAPLLGLVHLDQRIGFRRTSP